MSNSMLLFAILAPLALIIGLLVCLCFAVGFTVMLNVYKAGLNVAVDRSNYVGRLLGWIQTTRHIPKLMKAVFVWGQTDGGIAVLEVVPGRYAIEDAAGERTVVEIRRPLQNMQAQDLMEQMDFRPDDGRVT